VTGDAVNPAAPRDRRPVIGVTGGVASGKSAAARMLGELGCEVIDADRIGHQLLERPAVAAELVERFGPEIRRPDGSIDRRQLGRRAFADEEATAALNAVMHPPLRAELVRRIEAFRAGEAPAAVLDAALLAETDWHELCDQIVFVEAPRPQRLERARRRRGWSAKQFAAREKVQKPLDTKRAIAQDVLDNSSSESHLRKQVRLLYQRAVDPAA
jgi:dephospho-CoA kinase